MKNQIAFILLVCFFSHSVLACKCLGGSDNVVDDVTGSYKNSIAVVKAVARSVEGTYIPMDFTQGKATQVKAELTTFEVTKSWKGISTKTFRTKVATECCVCGLSFEIGKEYLLYYTLLSTYRILKLDQQITDFIRHRPIHGQGQLKKPLKMN